MSVTSINPAAYTTSAAANVSATASTSNSEKATSKEAKDSKKETSGVVYEKNSSNVNTDYVKKNSALISQLKADSDARAAQLQDIVQKMMQQQGTAIGQADSIWQFLAEGKFTVSADVKAQAQADIADDGYWGVEKTSDRILDFAKALSGNDPKKADEMLNAFKKGFEQATKSWGKSLPDISKKTYDAVIQKFDAWKNGTESASAAVKPEA